LEDLAALTGARVLDPKVESLDQVPSNVLGSIQTGSFTRTTSTFVAFEDKYEGIERRVSELQWLKDRTTSTFDVEQLNERIAKLSNGFCLMLVGAVTQTEIRERRGRIEDALNAVRCAIQSGIVPGGGISYLILSCILGDGMGDRVLREALKSPLTVLARNAGFAPEVILGRVLEASRGSDGPIPSWETGWDAITNTVRDFRTSPVIAEPLEVVKAIVRTAISTASTLLTAEVAITKV
jgi:chaperonin GroEL